MSTILVVDDDPDIRLALEELIGLLFANDVERGELRVVTATTGEEAVDLASRELPALTIMDVNLPGIDGIEAFFRIASAHDTPPRTLFLTGYAGSGPLQRRLSEAVGAGSAVVLSKPVTASVLAEHIERALHATLVG